MRSAVAKPQLFALAIVLLTIAIDPSLTRATCMYTGTWQGEMKFGREALSQEIIVDSNCNVKMGSPGQLCWSGNIDQRGLIVFEQQCPNQRFGGLELQLYGADPGSMQGLGNCTVADDTSQVKEIVSCDFRKVTSGAAAPPLGYPGFLPATPRAGDTDLGLYFGGPVASCLIDSLRESLGRGDSVRCVALDDSNRCIVVYESNRWCGWRLKEYLVNALSRWYSVRARIEWVSLQGGAYSVEAADSLFYNGDSKDLISRESKLSSHIHETDLGPGGTYCILGDKSIDAHAPQEMVKHLAEADTAKAEHISHAAIAPNGAWAIIRGANGWWTGGELPEGFVDALQAIHARNGVISCVAFGPSGSWIVVERPSASPALAAASPEPADNSPAGPADEQELQPQSEDMDEQQAELEKANREEQDTQDKIDELQDEVQSQQKVLSGLEDDIQQLQSTNNSFGGQRGLALAGAILQVGVAKFQQEEEDAREKIRDLQEQIASLEETRQQAHQRRESLRETVAEQTPDQSRTGSPPGSHEGQSSSSTAGGSYTGPYADWVHRLLSRVGDWSCPTSMSSQDGQPPQVSITDGSLRDQYVKSAALEAWAAECYAQHERDNEAQAQAAAMMKDLQAAESLCGNGGSSAGGPTTGVYRCGELGGGAGPTGTPGASTAYVYYEAHQVPIANQPLLVTIYTEPQTFSYEPGQTFLFAPVAQAERANSVVGAYLRQVDPSGKTVLCADCLKEEARPGTRQDGESQVRAGMNYDYVDFGAHRSSEGQRIVLLDPNTGNIMQQLQVAAAPAAPSRGGASRGD